jgi:hypothetical protein
MVHGKPHREPKQKVGGQSRRLTGLAVWLAGAFGGAGSCPGNHPIASFDVAKMRAAFASEGRSHWLILIYLPGVVGGGGGFDGDSISA